MNNYKQFLIFDNSDVSDINFLTNNGISVPSSSFSITHEKDSEGKTEKSHVLLKVSVPHHLRKDIVDRVTNPQTNQRGALIAFDETDNISSKLVFNDALYMVDYTYSKEGDPQVLTELSITAKQFILDGISIETN